MDKLCHFEIGTRDAARAKQFYSQVFDWRFEAKDGQEMIRTGDEVSGHFHQREGERRSYVIFYVMVDDVKATIAKAEAAGGKVVLGPEKEGPSGIYAWIADPEGNVVGIYTEK